MRLFKNDSNFLFGQQWPLKLLMSITHVIITLPVRIATVQTRSTFSNTKMCLRGQEEGGGGGREYAKDFTRVWTTTFWYLVVPIMCKHSVIVVK